MRDNPFAGIAKLFVNSLDTSVSKEQVSDTIARMLLATAERCWEEG